MHIILRRKKLKDDSIQNDTALYIKAEFKVLANKISIKHIEIQEENQGTELISIEYVLSDFPDDGEELTGLVRNAIAPKEDLEFVDMDEPAPIKRIEAIVSASQGIYKVDANFSDYLAYDENFRQDQMSCNVEKVIVGYQHNEKELSCCGLYFSKYPGKKVRIAFDRNNLYHCLAYALESEELRQLVQGNPIVQMNLNFPQNVVVTLKNNKQYAVPLPHEDSQKCNSVQLKRECISFEYDNFNRITQVKKGTVAIPVADTNKLSPLNSEATLTAVASRFFKEHVELSPKVFRKHPQSEATRFVMFKPEKREVALTLKSKLCESDLHAYISETPKTGNVCVMVNLSK